MRQATHAARIAVGLPPDLPEPQEEEDGGRGGEGAGSGEGGAAGVAVVGLQHGEG